MVNDLERVGRRGGGGFYDYAATGKSLWTELGQHFPVVLQQPSPEEVKSRLLTIQALEAARCVEADVVMHAADADIGSVLGIGFPAWTGGTLSYIDTLGMQNFVRECEGLAAASGPRFAPSDWLRQRAASDLRFHSMSAVAA